MNDKRRKFSRLCLILAVVGAVVASAAAIHAATGDFPSNGAIVAPFLYFFAIVVGVLWVLPFLVAGLWLLGKGRVV